MAGTKLTKIGSLQYLFALLDDTLEYPQYISIYGYCSGRIQNRLSGEIFTKNLSPISLISQLVLITFLGFGFQWILIIGPEIGVILNFWAVRTNATIHNFFLIISMQHFQYYLNLLNFPVFVSVKKYCIEKDSDVCNLI